MKKRRKQHEEAFNISNSPIPKFLGEKDQILELRQIKNNSHQKVVTPNTFKFGKFLCDPTIQLNNMVETTPFLNKLDPELAA